MAAWVLPRTTIAGSVLLRPGPGVRWPQLDRLGGRMWRVDMLLPRSRCLARGGRALRRARGTLHLAVLLHAGSLRLQGLLRLVALGLLRLVHISPLGFARTPGILVQRLLGPVGLLRLRLGRLLRWALLRDRSPGGLLAGGNSLLRSAHAVAIGRSGILAQGVWLPQLGCMTVGHRRVRAVRTRRRGRGAQQAGLGAICFGMAFGDVGAIGARE